MQPLSAENVRSEINVTPLVDVVLVLLIIFMVITPMLSQGPKVELPDAQNPPKKPETEDQLVITVAQDGSLWLENRSLPLEELGASLQGEYRNQPGRMLVIKGDAQTSYGDVKRALMAVKDGGFPEAGLIVEKLVNKSAH
jgi:biopolymer transport protein ExbD